ncbi:MAG TPA: hypothetical protein PK317_04790 [Coprothermobacter proteolyticus]|nr:hypothetical protein [Coprothermobacter proteolyticus]
MSLIKVQGHDTLFRDSESGAIVSLDKEEYNNFIAQHRSRLALERRVTDLESKLDKILDILTKDK